MKGSYDVIVVGAGPAGSAAAYTCAQRNLSTLLLERGPYPGSKNVFGGTLYSVPTSQVFPEFWNSAPLERPVVSEEVWIMDVDSAVKVGFSNLGFGLAPYNKITALRSRFDRWLAGQAVEVGAHLETGVTVQGLTWENDGLLGKRRKVSGVVLDTGDSIKANLVIVATGVMAELVADAGLRGRIPAWSLTLYVQEVLAMPEETIEERFRVDKGQGAVLGFLGYPTAGVNGKAGIWTNKESVSIIVGAYLDQMLRRGISPAYLLQRFREHPSWSHFFEAASAWNTRPI